MLQLDLAEKRSLPPVVGAEVAKPSGSKKFMGAVTPATTLDFASTSLTTLANFCLISVSVKSHPLASRDCWAFMACKETSRLPLPRLLTSIAVSAKFSRGLYPMPCILKLSVAALTCGVMARDCGTRAEERKGVAL